MKTVLVPAGLENGVSVRLHHLRRRPRQFLDISQDRFHLFIDTGGLQAETVEPWPTADGHEHVIDRWQRRAVGQPQRVTRTVLVGTRDAGPEVDPDACLAQLPAVVSDPCLAEVREVLRTLPARTEVWRTAPVASLAEVGFGAEEERYPRDPADDTPRTELGRRRTSSKIERRVGSARASSCTPASITVATIGAYLS